MSKKSRLKMSTTNTSKSKDIKMLETHNAKQISTERSRKGDLTILFSIRPADEVKLMSFCSQNNIKMLQS